MLFVQTILFFPHINQSRINGTTDYLPEHLGNIGFISYFSVLKTNQFDTKQVYRLTALPYFIALSKRTKKNSLDYQK